MAPSTLIRFQTKTELFCSVFKKICVHTYRFRIVIARPHHNAVSVLKTLLYPQWASWAWWRACSNELNACVFILVPRGRAPFGQNQESRPLSLCWPKGARPLGTRMMRISIYRPAKLAPFLILCCWALLWFRILWCFPSKRYQEQLESTQNLKQTKIYCFLLVKSKWRLSWVKCACKSVKRLVASVRHFGHSWSSDLALGLVYSRFSCDVVIFQN